LAGVPLGGVGATPGAVVVVVVDVVVPLVEAVEVVFPLAVLVPSVAFEV
jgi:hypothetical protein